MVKYICSNFLGSETNLEAHATVTYDPVIKRELASHN